MAAAVDHLLQQLPEGVDIYDGLQDYFVSGVYPLHPAFDRGATAMMALLAIVILAVAVSLVLRWRSTGIHWLTKDSAMTRLNLHTWGPLLMAIFAICEIILTASVLQSYRQHRWTAFVGGFQFLILTPLVVLAQILLVNIWASAPFLRQYLLRAGSMQHRGPIGVIILGSLVIALSLAAIGSALPPSVTLAKHTSKQTTDLNAILATISAARAANDKGILSGLAAQIQELSHTADKCKHAIQIGGSVFSGWCAVWIIAGALPYAILDRAVRKKIARLERSLQEENHRSASAQLSPQPLKIHLNQQAPAYGIEKPFSNLVPTSAMPEKYATVLDSQLVETADKIKRLRALLRQDAILHTCYLLIVLVYMSEAVFQAAGAVDAVPAKSLLPMLHSYNVAAFLLVGSPVVFLYLRDSIRLYRNPEPNHHARRRTAVDLSDLTQAYAIPLHLGKDTGSIAERNTGIQVSQMHQVVVEEEGKELRDEKDGFSFR